MTNSDALILDESDFNAANAAEERDRRRAARAFTEACKAADVDAFLTAVAAISHTVDGWRSAMARVGRLTRVSPAIRAAFLNVWIEHKHLPHSVGHRPTTAAALRVLMADGYRGPGLRLFRGTSFSERRRRLYGFSWTLSAAIAQKFAALHDEAHQRLPKALSPGVVLETFAPAEAILLKREREDYFDEDEVVVDPYRLGKVSVFAG